jgi:hypothetical protein
VLLFQKTNYFLRLWYLVLSVLVVPKSQFFDPENEDKYSIHEIKIGTFGTYSKNLINIQDFLKFCVKIILCCCCFSWGLVFLDDSFFDFIIHSHSLSRTNENQCGVIDLVQILFLPVLGTSLVSCRGFVKNESDTRQNFDPDTLD